MLSIVIPTYNSALNLKELILRIYKVMQDFELIFVDDNSTDDTLEILRRLCRKLPELKVISLSRNFGQQMASTCGLKYSKGEAVIIMDDDLQDPPEVLPMLIHKWKEGYDVVYAVRNRKDKKFLYTLFYKLFNRISYQKIPLDSGDFGLMSHRVVDVLADMPEHSRLLRGMRAWVGFKQASIVYDRLLRKRGKTGYNWLKIGQFAMYSLLAFSNMPLYLCLVFSLIALICGKYFDTMELFCMGILGKYIIRITDEVNQRPLYLIKERINI